MELRICYRTYFLQSGKTWLKIHGVKNKALDSTSDETRLHIVQVLTNAISVYHVQKLSVQLSVKPNVLIAASDTTALFDCFTTQSDLCWDNLAIIATNSLEISLVSFTVELNETECTKSMQSFSKYFFELIIQLLQLTVNELFVAHQAVLIFHRFFFSNTRLAWLIGIRIYFNSQIFKSVVPSEINYWVRILVSGC